jgi:hypothetical protein
MALYVPKPRRDRHLVQAAIIKTLGGAEAVASMWRCSKSTVEKATQDRERGSGQDLTFEHFQDMLREAGQRLHDLALQNLIDEYLHDHVLALCHRRAYVQDIVHDIIDVLQNGHRRAV